MDNDTFYGKIPTEGILIENNDTLAEKDALIEELTKQLESAKANAGNWCDRYNEKWSQFETLKNRLQTVLAELVENQDIGKSQAQRIAEVCDVELTREVRFTGTLSFDGTVEVSMFEDFDRYELSIDSLDLSYAGESIYDIQSDIEDAEEDNRY